MMKLILYVLRGKKTSYFNSILKKSFDTYPTKRYLQQQLNYF